MNTDILFNNLRDPKTTVPGLWMAATSVAAFFGIDLPQLPSWLIPVISVLGVLISSHLIFNVKSAPKPIIPDLVASGK
jgi:hypothetical protein